MVTMKNLLSRKALAGSDGMPVDEVFFHERTGHLRYVAIKTGRAFGRKDILVAIGRFSPPVAGQATWPVSLDADEIRAAPLWQDDEAEERVPVALEAWPPIITGPFGYTTSPLLMYAAYAAGEAEAEPSAPRAAPDPRLNRLERATQRLGAETFGNDGLLGRLDDMVIDPETLSVSHFVVGDRAVPYRMLRHMAEEGQHTVLDLDQPGLAALPSHRT